MRGKVNTTVNPAFFDIPEQVAVGSTLYVATAWPDGINTSRFFTSIAAALVVAATMSPSPSAPVLIVVFPGTYADALVLVSNVHIFGYTKDSVNITGAVTWTPGAGVNLGQTNQNEIVDLVLLQIAAPGSIAIDSTAKLLAVSALDLRDVSIKCPMTFAARAVSQADFFQTWGVITTGAIVFTNGQLNIFDGSIQGAMTFNGVDPSLNCHGSDVLANMTVNAGAIALYGSDIRAGAVVAVASGAFALLTGSKIVAGSLNVAAGGAADIRMGEYGDSTQLAGLGTIDRSIWRTTKATGVGANAVAIAPPLPNGSYNVALTLTAGPGNAAATVTAKAGSGFTLTDAVGGNTFDVTILKE